MMIFTTIWKIFLIAIIIAMTRKIYEDMSSRTFAAVSGLAFLAALSIAYILS